jgi:N-acetylglutamate synthase-like GNAT family acetyltransferase
MRRTMQEIIDRIEHSLQSERRACTIGKRTVFVAVMDRRVVGTASLDGDTIRTVFVSPDVQARGIGTLLMAEVERTARERKIPLLTVPSSLSAEAFYAQLGFRPVRDSYYGEERTIIMEQSLVDTTTSESATHHRARAARLKSWREFEAVNTTFLSDLDY